VEALEEAVAEGHKALVFSQWTSLLDRVEPHLTAEGIGFTGSTARPAIAARWSRSSRTPTARR
jgi:SNF2 family DNA or RNA helicase